MKKILIASNTSWFIFNFFRSSITEFMRDGNQVFVIAPRDAFTNRLIDLGCVFQELIISRSGMNPLSELRTFKQLYSFYHKNSPDVVLNFTPKINIYSTIAAKIQGIPIINSVAGLGSIFTEKGIKSWVGKSLLKLTQPLADHVVFQNPDDQSTYLKHGYVKKCNSSRVHGIGINLKHFRVSRSADDDVTRFILVARMLYNKGVPEFVHAAKRVQSHYAIRKLAGYEVPEFEFALLGFVDEDNPQGIPLAQLKHWHNNTLVNYLGETENVFYVLKHQDCVVLPSYYREGVPQCLIEAMAMAKPIITTDNVGCRETVDNNKSGYIVKPKSVPELKEAMIKMIELGHKKRLQFGSVGRKKAEKDFCHVIVSRHYLNSIEKVLTDSK